MLYVLYGTNREKVRDESHKMLSALRKKRPSAEVFRLSDEQETLSRLVELLESVGLFEHKHIVMLDYVLQYERVRELIASRLEDIVQSPHVFVLLDEAFDAKMKKLLEKNANEMREFDGKEKKEGRFNVFSIADAVARKNRKEAWVALLQALSEGIAPEEIHGVLWWQVKTLLLVFRGDTDGLKPFAVTKARGALKNFSESEINALLKKLLSMYHDARAGGPSLDIALEQFVLEL